MNSSAPHWIVIAASSYWLLACSSSQDPGDGASAGSAATGVAGQVAVGGGLSTAGQSGNPGGSSATGGAGVAGSPGNAGSAGMADTGACAPPPPYAEPTLAGMHAVGTTSYTLGNVTLGSLPSVSAPVHAKVFYPATQAGTDTPAAAGSFPVVLMLHGNHSIYREAGGATIGCDEVFVPYPTHLKTLSEVQEDHPGATALPNYLGYTYLGENLASAGYVFVTIDGNGVTCIPDFVSERAALMLEHTKALADAGSSADPKLKALASHLDLHKLIFAGHSRGAEASIVAAAAKPVPGTTLLGVLPVAPSTYKLASDAVALSASFLVVVPAADGDVSFNGGLRYYDAAVPSAGPAAGWFKAQQYVYGANHNFFNSEWNESYSDCGTIHPDGDNGHGNGDQRLSRAQQEHFLLAITRTFLDAVVGQNAAARAALSGMGKIAGLESVTATASFAEPGATLELPGAPSGAGFSVLDEFPFTQSKQAFNGSFFHGNSGYVGVWSSTPATFSLPAPAMPTVPRYVSLRVAQVVDDHNEQGRKLTLDVELEDGAGNRVKAGSDWASAAIPPWYPRPPWKDGSQNCQSVAVEKTVLETVRIPVGCFSGAPGFAFSSLKSISVSPRAAPGALAFSDFQLVE